MSLALASFYRGVPRIVEGRPLRKATSPRNELSSTDTYDAIVGALDRLLKVNISAGNLRPDRDAQDVILALAGLWQLDPASDWEGQAHRIYEIVLSGLQTNSSQRP
jgi:hypothetical protein